MFKKAIIAIVALVAISFHPSVPFAKPKAFEKNRTYTTEFGPAEYLIAPGDVLEIKIWRGFEERKYEVTVKPDGFVTVTFIESKLSDMTTGQAEKALKKSLAEYVREPRVEVSVKEYRGRTAAVFGAIHPGVYSLKGKTTLTHLMIHAGGLEKDADPENIQITARDGRIKAVNFFKIVSDPTKDEIIDDGDSIYVPSRTDIAEDYVFVLGEVTEPGAYKLSMGRTVSQAISTAEGFKEEGLINEIRVIRTGQGRRQVITADLRTFLSKGDIAQDVPLLKNDIVFVPKTKIANWNAFLAKLRPTLEFIVLPFVGAAAIQDLFE